MIDIVIIIVYCMVHPHYINHIKSQHCPYTVQAQVQRRTKVCGKCRLPCWKCWNADPNLHGVVGVRVLEPEGGGEALPESMRELMAKLMAEDILSPEEHAELVNAFITTVR